MTKKILMILDSDSIVLIGLDCETTGSDIDTGARLFNGALALKRDGLLHMREVNLRPDHYTWSVEAEKVHMISEDRVKSYPQALVAEKELEDFLLSILPSPSALLVPVGFNVGSFDLPFFRKAFPSLMQRFSHRVVDLNSLLLFLAVAGNGGVGTFEDLKKLFKERASKVIKEINPDLQAHQAGYDSLEALLILDQIRSVGLKNYSLLV